MRAHTKNYEQYPDPKIPLAPVLSGQSLRLSSNYKDIDSILSCNETMHITSGRAGIVLALKDAGVVSGDEVLLPAYHSLSMIPPVTWCAASTVFYQINIDTCINNEDIEKKITPHTKAMIVTHYFGILQDLTKVRELCDKKNIALIEDCAHAFFGAKNGAVVGTQGDYAIASSMKFFPCFDGGILASSNKKLSNITLEHQPISLQLKSLFNILERSVGYSRLGIFGKILKKILALKSVTWAIIKNVNSTNRELTRVAAATEGGYDLDESWIHKNISTASGIIVNKSNGSRIVKKRRENYKKIYDSMKHLSTAYPLFEAIDDHCVPLLFPLYVKNPQQAFDTLKRQGVPIWRFGEHLDPRITIDEYPDSIKLSKHVLQFPCHQELSTAEIDWMLTLIKQAIK